MHSWDQIVQLIAAGELQLLQRTAQTTERYHKYKQELLQRNTTVVDVVVDEKLQWDRELLRQLALQHQDTPTAILSSPTLYTLLPNDFPYDFPSEVHHLVLWSKLPIPLYVANSRQQVPAVRDLIERFLRTNLERYRVRTYAWFINYPHLQSVKTISHIHLLVNSPDVNCITEMLESGFRPVEDGK
ncbi:LADA_0D04808g1_1 [Lachancea dasiensis]|uniref:LADA_0D04808g1_1 n=1 Tax=Lachancea dasiensis TaxID=1072105 RepID=A0A1G4J5J9_9SACH|nr:LADA_0D04808g1_1 [Lachancea dasiensis]